MNLCQFEIASNPTLISTHHPIKKILRITSNIARHPHVTNRQNINNKYIKTKLAKYFIKEIDIEFSISKGNLISNTYTTLESAAKRHAVLTVEICMELGL